MNKTATQNATEFPTRRNCNKHIGLSEIVGEEELVGQCCVFSLLPFPLS